MEGVTASVDLATGRSRVSHPVELPVEELVATVEKAGCTAVLALPVPVPHQATFALPEAPPDDGSGRSR
ncbi:heavy metal-associated domain-containing protein [Streptomyces sp. NPDC057027]|uniref:heavy-metal-associated domain-containing protein n=1 Tax=Streptomyces sp. NPDC057027 TaxID=3346004 RepID=UPI00363BD612